MGDLLVVSRDGSAHYYEEVPVDYVHDSEFGAEGSYFVITLEYGPDHDQHDPFDVSVGRIKQSDANNAEKGRYLHPVVRHFSARTLLSEHHVAENLENDWSEQTTHREPLRAFFARELGGPAQRHVDAALAPARSIRSPARERRNDGCTHIRGAIPPLTRPATRVGASGVPTIR